MPLDDRKARLLRTCFTEREWEYLNTVPRFNELISNAKDEFDAVERLTYVGNWLVLEQEERELKLQDGRTRLRL